MPVWLEVFIAWAILGSILNIAAMIVFRKKGYFKWLNKVYDSNAYHTGYEDAKKELNGSSSSVYSGFPRSVLLPQLREHGVEDTRYN